MSAVHKDGRARAGHAIGTRCTTCRGFRIAFLVLATAVILMLGIGR